MAPLETPSPDPSSLPELLDDLRLHQRKAFELCAIVLGAFRQCQADPLEEALKETLETARKIADAELRTQNDGVPIATFLADALAKVVRTARESAELFPLGEAGRDALDLLTGLQSTLPNNIGPACRMTGVFGDCRAAAQKFYSDHLTPPYRLPEISFGIRYAESPNQALPGRTIAFNGSVTYQDDQGTNTKHSIVKLTVHPVLNSGCLPALPYVLMHEVLCHWPQMARWHGDRPNPRKIDHPNKNAAKYQIDPFAEAWMDSLVADALRRHFGDTDPSSAEEAQTAEDIHSERTVYNRMPAYGDASRIAPGTEAARLVRWFYRTDDDSEIDPSTADPDFQALSCELNIAAWDYEQRLNGCIALIGACRAFQRKREQKIEPSEKFSNIISGLRDFRKDRDASRLLNLILLH